MIVALSSQRILLAFVCYAVLAQATLAIDGRRPPFASPEAGEPLFLTPLIDTGNLTEARDRSRVTPLLENIESHSGFLTVNKTTGSHLYFWFIKTTANVSAPTIVWLQGGPGCSSLFGLFAENGPFKVVGDGLQKREHAWTDHYNMLYFDNPVGVGFSFTESGAYASDEDQVGDQLHEALVQFYKMFADLRESGLYLAGESYGGKYVPAAAHKIHVANQRGGDIPLKGLLYGNGWSDPENQYGWGPYLEDAGLIDEQDRLKLDEMEKQIVFAIRSGNWTLATDQDDRMRKDVRRMLHTISLYDYTRDNFSGFDDSFVEFLTQDRIRERLHVGGVKYEINTDVVGERLYDDFQHTVRPWIEELLEHYPMLFYNGQFDIVCAHTFTDNFLKKLHWSGASRYGFARKQVWRVDDMVGGFYKAAGNLVFMVVRNAGHNVPIDQPRNSLALIDAFIEKKFT